MGIVPNWKDAFIVLQVLSALGISMYAGAYICEVGREKDETDTWRWVLAHTNPCECHKIVMGGVNTRTPIRPYKPKYVDSPLISDDVDKIRKHYELDCKAYWGVFGNWSTCSKTCGNGSQTREANCVIPEFTRTSCNGPPPNETRNCNIGNCPAWSAWISWSACSWNNMNKWSDWDLYDDVICGIGTRVRIRICDSSFPNVPCHGRQIDHECCEQLNDHYNCQQALGMENHDIPDNNLSSSKYYTHNGMSRMAKYARLNHPPPNFWATEKILYDTWIQVDLGKQMQVNGIIVQGANIYYIQKLKIATGLEADNRTHISSTNGDAKVFETGLNNPSDLRTISFDTRTAQFIRIEPIEETCFENDGKQSEFCCLRFEVLGCKIDLPLGWKKFNSSVYVLFKTISSSKTYIEARDACTDQNAVLTSVRSQEEQDFLYSFLKEKEVNNDVWIGLNDIQEEGIWSWEDGTQFIYTHWGVNAPSNTDNKEDCVHFRGDELWNDDSCSIKLAMYICKIDIVRQVGYPLGMSNGQISENQITASSTHERSSTEFLGPGKGRLNFPNGHWSPLLSDTSPWIQVNFSSSVNMTALRTQGSGFKTFNGWVKEMVVLTGRSTDTLSVILHRFSTNSDRTSISTILFPRPVCASIVRIEPKTWNAHCALHFEVLGYQQC